MIRRLLLTVLAVGISLMMSAQLIEISPIIVSPKILFISTNGTIGSFNPKIPDTTVTFTSNGPYVYSKSGYENKNLEIKNLCPSSIINLYPDTQRPTLTTYQWYKCVATAKAGLIRSGTSPYVWGNWVAVDTARVHDVSTANDFARKLFSPKVLHVAYFCKIMKRSLLSKIVTVSYTGLTAISRADKPTFKDFVVQSASVCPGADVVVDPDFDVDGDGLNIFWQRETEATPGVWTSLTGSVAPFSFPSATYLNETYDYRMAVSNSCGTVYATSLRDMPIVVAAAFNESYAPATAAQLTKTTCIGSPTSFQPSIVGVNSFHTYTYFWEYKAASATTWTKISADNAVFQGSNTLTLTVTPSDTTYNNMQFRCTTNGACATITSTPYTIKTQAVPQITALTSSQNPACQTSSVTFTPTVKPSAFVSSVEYSWSVNDNVVVPFSSTETSYKHNFLNNAVSVKCQVRSNNTCVSNFTSQILQVPVIPLPDVSINVTSTGCGGTTATLLATSAPTKPNYTYSWSPTVVAPTVNKLTNQASGKRYFVTLTDGCGKSDTASVYVSSFPALSLVCSKTDVLCNGQSNGKILANVAGGVTPYDIKVTKVSTNSTVLNLVDTPYSYFNVANLAAGEYTVLVTDACNATKTVNMVVNQPAPLVASIVRTKQVTCNAGGDGEAELSIIGGTEPYAINWSNAVRSKANVGLFAGTYVANVTDNNGCFTSTQTTITQPNKLSVTINKTNVRCNAALDGAIDLQIIGGTAPINSYIVTPDKVTVKGTSFKKLKAGVYSVVVTDNCGVSFKETVTLTEPEALRIVLASSNVSCANQKDGAASVAISGGVAPYIYGWNTKDSTLLISSLDSAYYAVTVRDQCDTVSDGVRITKPAELQASITSTNISCYGLLNGSATATADGGTYPYSFNWNNGKTDQAIENLSKGKYTVMVSDARGCIKQQSATISEPEKLEASVSSVVNADCFGKATGSIAVAASKGVADYSYKWTNKLSTTENAINLNAGTYSVTVSDFCKDSVVLSATVSQPDSLSVDQNVVNPRCNNEKSGTITLFARGGVGTYQYAWSDNKIGNTRFAKQLGAETYVCTVSDNCTQKSVRVSLVEPSVIVVDEKKSDASCEKSSDGWIALKPVGGTEPYSVSWSFGAVRDSIGGLFPGLYSYSLHDANGCTASGTIEIAKPTALEVTAVGGSTACKQADGTALATVTGGTAPYTFKWNNKATDAKATGLVNGLYTVTVTDSKGCKAQTSATVGVSIKQYPICMVTVDSSGKANKVIWEKDNDQTIDSIRIYCFYGTYRKVGQVKASAPYSVYNDYMAKPRQTSYQYAISTLDKCGNESPLSYSHSTVLLWSNFSTEPNKANIEWTPYIDESGKFVPTYYYVYKGNSYMDMKLIDSVPGSSSIYIDQSNDGARYYRVSFKKTACVVTGLKSDSGPFSQSLSNMSEASLVGIDSLGSNTIAVYPNPVSSELHVTIAASISADARIKLIASDGKVLVSKQLTDAADQIIDMNPFSAGLYEVVIENNNTIERKTITKY